MGSIGRDMLMSLFLSYERSELCNGRWAWCDWGGCGAVSVWVECEVKEYLCAVAIL